MANIELTLTPASPTGSMIFTLGAPGPQGLAGTMEVGTVTTGAPGSSATIVNVGTPSAAILDFEIPRGDKGDQGDPGPAGVVYATAPLSYDSGTQTISIDLSAYATQSFVTSQGYITASALSGYATESWVTSRGYITSSALTPYLTSATAASTYQTLAGMSSYLTTSAAASTYLAKSGGYITGDIQSSNGSGYRTWDGSTMTGVFVPAYLQFNKSGVGGGALTVEWDGITFADGKQTSRYPGIGVLDGLYYPLSSNPAGYLTSASLSGYATESWVSSQGFETVSNAAATYYPLSNPSGFIGDAPSDGTPYGRQDGSWVSVGSGGGAVWGGITGTLSDQTDLQSALNAKISFDIYGGVQFPYGYSSPNARRLYFDGNDNKLHYSTASVSNNIIASESYVGAQGYITSSALTPYAQLAGATFTGKVNASPSTAGSAGFNLGAGVAPTSPVAGDIWTASNTDTLRYRAPLTNQTFDVATRNATNTFNSPNIIDTTSNTLAALRITQKGTFPALVVEDSTNPDTTATVIDANGNLGVGVDASTWTAANKVEVVGNLKATAFVNGTGPTYNVKAIQTHSGGVDTHELLVSVNGSTYRIGMKFVSTP